MKKEKEKDECGLENHEDPPYKSHPQKCKVKLNLHKDNRQIWGGWRVGRFQHDNLCKED